MNDPLQQAIAGLPAYVDRDVLQLIIKRYPPDAHLPFVQALSEVLLPDTGEPKQDLSYSLWMEGDAEVTALLGKLLKFPAR